MPHQNDSLPFELIQPAFYAFDYKGNTHCLKSEQANLWIGYSKFAMRQMPGNENLENRNLNNAAYNQIYQRQAVRQLLKRLLDQLITTSQLSSANFDIWLDESSFPYQLKPIDYYVSFSHSQQQVVCAVSQNKPVGIDVELRFIPYKIAKRYFHPIELQWLSRLDETQQHMAINLLWQLKEALLKKNMGKSLAVQMGYDNSDVAKQLFKLSTRDFDVDKKNHFALIDTILDDIHSLGYPSTLYLLSPSQRFVVVV